MAPATQPPGAVLLCTFLASCLGGLLEGKCLMVQVGSPALNPGAVTDSMSQAVTKASRDPVLLPAVTTVTVGFLFDQPVEACSASCPLSPLPPYWPPGVANGPCSHLRDTVLSVVPCFFWVALSPTICPSQWSPPAACRPLLHPDSRHPSSRSPHSSFTSPEARTRIYMRALYPLCPDTSCSVDLELTVILPQPPKC